MKKTQGRYPQETSVQVFFSTSFVHISLSFSQLTIDIVPCSIAAALSSELLQLHIHEFCLIFNQGSYFSFFCVNFTLHILVSFSYSYGDTGKDNANFKDHSEAEDKEQIAYSHDHRKGKDVSASFYQISIGLRPMKLACRCDRPLFGKI